MKSIQNQYVDLKEGKISQINFMRNLRMTLPQYITNVTSFNDSIKILKNKGILSEISSMKPQIVVNPEGNTAMNSIASSPQKINDPDYTVWVYSYNQNKIVSGWSYLEDARDFVKEQNNRLGKLAIYGKKKLKQLGIDPNDDNCWGTDMVKESMQGTGPGEEDQYDYMGKRLTIDPESAKNIGDIADLYDEESNGYEGEVTKIDPSTKMIYVDPNSIKPIGHSALNEAKKNWNQDGKEEYSFFKKSDNVNWQELTTGMYIEYASNPHKTYEQIEKIVLKNLNKNPHYYTYYKLTGTKNNFPQVIDSNKPGSDRMKFVEKDNIVDKDMGMKQVPGFENAKASANKAKKETVKPVKNIKLMSLIPKSVRGVKKMDPTGEKMKKINTK
jgi:hypothetical protein